MKIKLNDPKLRNANQSIEIDGFNQIPWNDMFKLCYNENWEQIWVWVALPQVWINKTGFIIDYKNLKEVVINPKIIWKETNQYIFEESCLSLWKDVKIKISRSNYIIVEYINLQWKLIKKELKWFESRVFQHEYDHLIGKLIIDYK